MNRTGIVKTGWVIKVLLPPAVIFQAGSDGNDPTKEPANKYAHHVYLNDILARDGYQPIERRYFGSLDKATIELNSHLCPKPTMWFRPEPANELCTGPPSGTVEVSGLWIDWVKPATQKDKYPRFHLVVEDVRVERNGDAVHLFVAVDIHLDLMPHAAPVREHSVQRCLHAVRQLWRTTTTIGQRSKINLAA